MNIADCSYTPPNSWNMFSGWNTKADGTGTAYTVGQSVSNLTDTNNDTVILYAQWSNKTYNITYLDQEGLEFTGGFVGSYPTVHTFGTDTALVSPVRIGYDFSGWYIAAGCEGLSLTTLNGTVYDDDIVLYAKWTPITYTINYNANGGTGEMSNMSMTYDVAANLTSNSFELSGRTMLGWSIDKHEIGDFSITYENGQAVSNLTVVQGSTITLYAVWNAIVGDIAYSDGTFSPVYNANKTPIGIVCYPNTNGTSGKIAHLSEQSSLAWCLGSADGYDCKPATSRSDGSNNWQIICDAVSDEDTVGNYPAFEYVNSLGDGWYLPAKDELNQIYTNKEAINTALNALSSGGITVKTIGTSTYWSSSSNLYKLAWYQRFSDGLQYNLDGYKDNHYSVRAFRAF